MSSSSPISFSSSNLEMEEEEDSYSVDIESEEYGERTLSPHTVTKNSSVSNNEFYRTSLRRQNCCFGFSVVTIAGLFVAAYFMMGLSFTPSNIGIFGDESHLKGGSGEVGIDASNAQIQAVIDEEITELEEEGSFGDEAVDPKEKRAKAAKIHQQFKDMINNKEKVGENKWVENKNWWKENVKNIDMAEEMKNKKNKTKKTKNEDNSNPMKEDKLKMRCERQKRNGKISDKCKELEMTDVDSIEDKLVNQYNFTIVGEGKESMLPDDKFIDRGDPGIGKRGKAKKRSKSNKQNDSKNEQAEDIADAEDSDPGKTGHIEDISDEDVDSGAGRGSDGEEYKQEDELPGVEQQNVVDQDEKADEEAQGDEHEDAIPKEEEQNGAVETEKINEEGMHIEEEDSNEEGKEEKEGQTEEDETEEVAEVETKPMVEENEKVMSNKFEILEQVIHDETSFTQGISYGDDGIIYETTGLYGSSKVRRINPETFEVEMSVDTKRKYFGEGSTFYRDPDGNGRIIEITWREQTGFIYDSETLEIIDEFEYSTTPPRHEGWGITYDEGNREFIVSDGSQYLFFWDRDTLEEKRKVLVTRFDGRPQGQLNELEFMDGLVCCNIWHVDEIICVDPSSGKSVWEFDMRTLWPANERGSSENVLNGIALGKDHVLLTGKRWDRMYKVVFPEWTTLFQ